MGAADHIAGAGPAGFSPVAAIQPTRRAGPRALAINLVTRDATVGENGQYEDTHPVDHRVQLALGVKLGSIPSSKTVGGSLWDLPIGDTDTMTADADRRVRSALTDLIVAGDVEVVSVTAWASLSYRAKVRVVYENKRLPSPDAIDRQRALTLGEG